MKRQLLSFLFALVTMSTMGQTIGEAIYIYRNDGQFDAFFRDEVERIEYSYEDADGVSYPDVVAQLVYTQDSVYNIPLAVIDSVSFVQPETVINKDVFPLTAAHAPYISEADTLSFVMAAATPSDMLPKKGNIVVATADCDAFPDGIVARVVSVATNSRGYVYVCEPASFDDVFEQLVLCEVLVDGGDAGAKARSVARKRAEMTRTQTLWDKSWNKTIAYSGTTTQLDVNDRAAIRVTMRKTLTSPIYAQVEVENTLGSSIGFNAKSTASITPDPVQFGNTLTVGKIPIPIPYVPVNLLWLEPKLSIFGYFKEEGTVELNYSAHFTRGDRMTFTYSGGAWSYAHAPRNDYGTDIANLSMRGYAEVGVIPKVYFSLNGTKMGFGANVQVGVKESINFLFDATKLKDGGLYAANKESYCRTTIPYSVTLYANANLFGKYDAANTEQGRFVISKTFAKEPQWGKDKYLLPLFSNLRELKTSSANTALPTRAAAGTHTVSVQVSRDVLLPTEIGMQLTDEDGNVVDNKTAGYNSKSFNNNSYTFAFSGLQSGKEYYARPTVGMANYAIPADQAITLKDEQTACPDNNHPHWIDLGLPSGTQWQCCNEGASAPEAYGGYYAFGQVASAPSLAQIQEFINNTTSEWTTLNGVNGRRFTGPNGGSVFLPAAGYRWYGEFYSVGSDGFYWSSTPYDEDGAYGLFFDSDDAYWGYTTGYYYDVERSVRPVR